MKQSQLFKTNPPRRATPSARTTLNQRIIDWAIVAYDYCAMLRVAPRKMTLGSMLTALTLERAQEVKNLTDGPTGEFRVQASG